MSEAGALVDWPAGDLNSYAREDPIDAFKAGGYTDPVVIGLDARDVIAPMLSVAVAPWWLWPAKHKYVDVNLDPKPGVTLLSVTSSEADRGQWPGDKPDDIVIIDDFTFRLRAERFAYGFGRVYTITYQVTDAAGNATTANATVTVPRLYWGCWWCYGGPWGWKDRGLR